MAPGDELRFQCGRDGDFLMTPFQCDLCHFRNIQLRNPRTRDSKDMQLMEEIRHCNINALWSREPSTVSGNLGLARKMEKIGRERFGFTSVSPALGPFPLEDSFGMRAACVLLRRSLDPGRHERFIQFATARRIRSAFSNVYHASREMSSIAAMAYQSTKTYSTDCPTYGYWFERFMLGCHKRMGDYTVTDYALSKEILMELLEDLEFDYQRAETDAEKDEIVWFANLLVIGFLNGLRGEEIMKVDVAGLLKYLDVGAADEKHPHVIVPLIGRLKGETGEQYHMFPMARVTKSGIAAGKWADRLGIALVRQGRRRGFVFVNARGTQSQISDYNPEFIVRLERVRARSPMLFEPNLDIADSYGLKRSLRRGSNSEAINGRVPKDIIELINRWRTVENARGRNPSFSMTAHYTEIRLVLGTMYLYSYSF